MKIIISFLTTLLLFTALVANGAGETVLVYRETTGQDVEEVSYYITVEDSTVLIRADFQDEWHDIFADSTFNTKGLKISFSETPVRIIISRKDDRLEVEGTNSRSIPADSGVPWYQTLISLKTFVLSGESKRSFYSLSSHFDERLSEGRGIQMFRLVAKKKMVENIEVGGQKIEAVKVIVTFNDIRSMFWKAYYWYRTDDGLLVQYREVRGGPGTPETIGILESEKEWGEQNVSKVLNKEGL